MDTLKMLLLLLNSKQYARQNKAKRRVYMKQYAVRKGVGFTLILSI